MPRHRYFCDGTPDAAPCHICGAGDGLSVQCCRCRRDIGCHILPTPLYCPSCSIKAFGYDHMMQSWRFSPEIRDFLLRAEAA